MTKLEKEEDKKQGSWGSWLPGWTSWYGYDEGNMPSVPGDKGTNAKVTFSEPVSEGMCQF